MKNRILFSLGAEELSSFGDTFIFEGEGIFRPTLTTSLLLKSALEQIEPGMKILDLGCGSGIIGLEIAARYGSDVSVFMSDLSKDAVTAARTNMKKLGLNCEIREGSLFTPWEKSKFDLILNDVSGISTLIPFADIWFKGIPMGSGEDGLNLFEKVIRGASSYLVNPNTSVILTALVSLSNLSRAKTVMNNEFINVNMIKEQFWTYVFVDENSSANLEANLLKLKKEGIIEFSPIEPNSYKFFTQIYKLSETKE